MATELRHDDRLLRKRYFRTLLPVMFSMLGGTANALIDSALVSVRLGRDALSAVTLSMPVYLVLCTVGTLFSAGAMICSSREAGRGKMHRAREYYRTAFDMGIAASVIITLFGVLLGKPVSMLLANGSELWEKVYSYTLVTFAGSGAFIMLYVPLGFLQLDGKNRYISLCITLMVVSDLLLDILLIYSFDLGLGGAAAASVVSSLLAALCGFFALGTGSTNYTLGKVHLRGKNILLIIKNGSAMALGKLYDALKLHQLNVIVLLAAGEGGAAVWAVLNTLSELSQIIISGVPRAASPIISTYCTARENSGIRILNRIQLETGLALSVLYTAAIVILHRPIEILFNINVDMTTALICLGLSVVFSSMGMIWERHMNSISRITVSNVSAFLRTLLLPIAFAALFAFRVKALPLWFFLPMSGAVSLLYMWAVVTVAYLASRRTDKPLSPVLLLDDTLEREHRTLSFSISANMDEACSAAEQIKDFCMENSMSTKAAMKLGLAIEEFLNVLIARVDGIASVDVFLFVVNEVAGIRISCAGRKFDPFRDMEKNDDLMMGVNMIRDLTDTVVHTYTLGLNIITVMLDDERK